MQKLDIYTKRAVQIAFKTTPQIKDLLTRAAAYNNTTVSTLTEYIIKEWLKENDAE